MSHHEDPRNNPELDAALKAHGLKADGPSQLSDAFRLAWWMRDEMEAAKAAENSKAGFMARMKGALSSEIIKLQNEVHPDIMEIAAAQLLRSQGAMLEQGIEAVQKAIDAVPRKLLCACGSCENEGVDEIAVPIEEMRWDGKQWVCENCWVDQIHGSRELALRLTQPSLNVVQVIKSDPVEQDD